jgi:hypothetical protein
MGEGESFQQMTPGNNIYKCKNMSLYAHFTLHT